MYNEAFILVVISLITKWINCIGKQLLLSDYKSTPINAHANATH